MWRPEECTRGEWRNARPCWLMLYLVAGLVVALVGLAEVFVDGDTLRTIVETALVVVGFGLLVAWVRFNRIALDLERARRHVRR